MHTPKVELKDSIDYGQILQMAMTVLSILGVGIFAVSTWARNDYLLRLHDGRLDKHQATIELLVNANTVSTERQAQVGAAVAEFRAAINQTREDVASIKGLLRQQQKDRLQ